MCSNDVFGDPLPGTKKNCFCSAGTANKTNTTEHDMDWVTEEYTWGQIKLIGNNDGRTVMINTTERNITATLSTHLDVANPTKKVKRPAGNCRGKRSKFAFVQDNGDAKQMWKKETHPKVQGAFRLVDETNYCLWASQPQDFKRNKNSAFVTAIPGQKGKCTFWEKHQSGDGWNIVMARPGIKNGQQKYANMNGWGLAVLGWCRGGDCELGPDRMYLAMHKKERKWSIWTSRIFATPPEIIWMFDHPEGNETDDANATADGNSTENATDTAPAAASTTAAPAAPAAPAASGAAAQGNATNGTNGTNKSKKPKKKGKKKLPEPYAGDNSDDDAAGADLTWDIDEDEDFSEYEWREKVQHASEMYELPAGYLHVKFLKWLKLFDDDE